LKPSGNSIGFISTAADWGSTPDPATKGPNRAFFIFMVLTVFVLYSETNNKYFTSYTTNLETRLKSHNEFGKGWNSKYWPWRLIFRKDFDNKSDAMEYEACLKTGVGRDFIKTINIKPGI
jgi:putative endonuclease